MVYFAIKEKQILKAHFRHIKNPSIEIKENDARKTQKRKHVDIFYGS